MKANNKKILLLTTIILLIFATTSFADINSNENLKDTKIELDYYFQEQKNKNNSFDISTDNTIENTTKKISNNTLNNTSNNTSNNNLKTTNETKKTTENVSEQPNETITPDTILNINAQSCILIENTTRRVAYEKNSEEKLYPASTTKVLTAILTLENCNLTDTVTITPNMISNIPKGYTTAGLKKGEKVTIEQLLNLLLIPSANDAGYALAIHISGSIEEFANLMNAKATEIGCTNSNFTNPSGIHDENHYSTAKDMAIIALYAQSYPQILDIVCKTSYELDTGNTKIRTYNNTNTLIQNEETNYYKYATGMKTGFTTPAGACLIATAKKDNMQFTAVILNAPPADFTTIYRDLDAVNLFEYGFANYNEITKKEEIPLLNNLTKITSINQQNIYKFILAGLIIIGLYIFITMINLKKRKNR